MPTFTSLLPFVVTQFFLDMIFICWTVEFHHIFSVTPKYH